MDSDEECHINGMASNCYEYTTEVCYNKILNELFLVNRGGCGAKYGVSDIETFLNKHYAAQRRMNGLSENGNLSRFPSFTLY